MVYSKWCFILTEGEPVYAYFSDQEIIEMKIKYPEVKWCD